MRKRGRSRHAGVADYFAVLGIGSFLPEGGGGEGACDERNNGARDVSSNGEGDAAHNIATDGRASPPLSPLSDPDGAADDAVVRSASQRTVRAGNLSSHSHAKTPKNSNLSRRRLRPEEGSSSSINVSSIPEDGTEADTRTIGSQGSKKGGTEIDATNAKEVDEEYRLREERFQREIVEVALVTDQSELDSEWTFSNDASLPLCGSGSMTNGQNCNVRLAYRRRGQNAMHDDENGCDDSAETANHPQHYYARGIADVALHYVKVRPSTIPNFASYAHSHPLQQIRQEMDERDSHNLQPSPVKSTVAAGLAIGAKQLGSLARRAGLALPPAGKEMAAGLVGAVTSRSPVELLGSGTGGGKDGKAASPKAPQRTAKQQLQPNHLWDTGHGGSFETDITGAVTPFQDLHGDVKLWQSKSEAESDSDVFSGVNSSTGETNSDMATVPELGVSPISEKDRRREHFFPDSPGMPQSAARVHGDGVVRRALHEMLPLPDGYDEWAMPDFCNVLHLPTPELVRRRREERQRLGSQRQPLLVDRTHTLPSPTAGSRTPSAAGVASALSPSSIGMEAMYLSPSHTPRSVGGGVNESPTLGVGADSPVLISHTQMAPDPAFLPSLASMKSIPGMNRNAIPSTEEDAHVYVPILAVRRQLIGEAERFHEDAALVDVQVALAGADGTPPQIVEEDDDDDDFGRGSSTLMQTGAYPDILKKSPWTPSSGGNRSISPGQPLIFLKRNRPNGFADLPFPATVLDRFPQGNYRGMPFPEEELPMFCYAGGSLLTREKMGNAGLPKSYGFVVKNERGDSIYGTLPLAVPSSSSR